MFLNDLSIYSIPFVGIVLLIIGLSSSKTIRSWKYQSSNKQKKCHSVNQFTTNTQNSHLSIQVNPFAQLSHIDSYRQRSTALLLDDDDDEELIKSDISTISASNFCENTSIELRLDQDIDYDTDLPNGKST